MPIFADMPQNLNLDWSIDKHGIKFTSEDKHISGCICGDFGEYGTYYQVIDSSESTLIKDLPMEFSLTFNSPDYIPLCKTIKFLQNRTVNETEPIVADVIHIGEMVNESKPQGEVVFKDCKTSLISSDIRIEGGTVIREGCDIKFKTR